MQRYGFPKAAILEKKPHRLNTSLVRYGAFKRAEVTVNISHAQKLGIHIGLP